MKEKDHKEVFDEFDEFTCPNCGKVTPSKVYYSFPLQADCPKCNIRLTKNGTLKIMSEEEVRKMRPDFYPPKNT